MLSFDSGLPDCKVMYVPDYISNHVALMGIMLEDIQWSQEVYKFGSPVQEILIPRLTAWYGDEDAHYRYSGIDNKPLPWTSWLRNLRLMLEKDLGTSFNSVLLNRYRTGKDSVAWHSDNEKELGANPVIASISLGASRKFSLKSKADRSITKSITLDSGSLLVMAGETQSNYLHCIPKTTKEVGERINLTFRNIQK
jgi:alkylated DNA repair dioxygenase AlkB